jgi:DNA polymerase-3 subunit epsilon
MSLTDLNLAIVDVETTGSRPTSDKIIEIGILKIERGKLVETFSTFVNPYQPISPVITSLTGITDRDVADAPDFSDISRTIHELLDDSVFVAHNVGFDYNFFRAEFGHREERFAPDRLCTVRLSRALYPSYRRHNLDALMERFNISCKNRHRALDDARVLWSFLQTVSKNFPPSHLEPIVNRLVQTIAAEPVRYAPI